MRRKAPASVYTKNTNQAGVSLRDDRKGEKQGGNVTVKFQSVAACEGNEKYESLLRREYPLYSRSDDVRSPFARDYTRVLHSLAYRRLKHKTQVFFNAAGNDHICTRIEHVAHVESVSTTIAGRLGLNVELTRAIAIAHDLGHAPFGHEGERVLSGLTRKYLGVPFWHEQNGVYFVDSIELLSDIACQEQNLNLTYGVRDGIISHCGEVDQNGLFPREECFDLSCFTRPGQYNSASWEGCVVKMADKIAYLGRDIEDADRLGFFDESQKAFLRSLARVQNEQAINTTVIMHNMIIDLCAHSDPEHGICLGQGMSRQMDEIKQFNYEAIYRNRRLNPYKNYSKLVLEEIFHRLMEYDRGPDTLISFARDAGRKEHFVLEFMDWLARYCDPELLPADVRERIGERYRNRKIYGRLEEKQYPRAVIDFIAGMTDSYAAASFEELLNC